MKKPNKGTKIVTAEIKLLSLSLSHLVTMENERLNRYNHKSVLRFSRYFTFLYFSLHSLADMEIEIKCKSLRTKWNT